MGKLRWWAWPERGRVGRAEARGEARPDSEKLGKNLIVTLLVTENHKGIFSREVTAGEK